MTTPISNSALAGSQLTADKVKRDLHRFRATPRTRASRFALFCAAASKGAYEDASAGWNETVFPSLGYDLSYEDDRATDTQFTLLESDEILCVAFRGTKGFADIFRDINKRFFKKGKLNVHAGFWKALSSIWAPPTNLQTTLQQAADQHKPVILTGHSLGAALAFLTSCQAEQVGINVRRVLTFGQPQAGAADFIARHPHSTAITTRFVNARDLVTLVPHKAILKLGSPGPRGRRPVWLRYEHHVGQLFYIQMDGQHVPNLNRRRLARKYIFSAFSNAARLFSPTLTFHQMDRYYKHVKTNAAAIDAHIHPVL